jgi:hypothetical protein
LGFFGKWIMSKEMNKEVLVKWGGVRVRERMGREVRV